MDLFYEQNNNDIDSFLNHFNDIHPDMESDRQSLYFNCGEFVSDIIKSCNDVLIMHFNTRSLLSKMSELTSLSVRVDIICISETWLNESTVDLVNIDNYTQCIT